MLNDREAEQCEVLKVEAIERPGDEGDAVNFLGITLLYIPANDLDRRHTTVLPSVTVSAFATEPPKYVPSLYPRVGVSLMATWDDRSFDDQPMEKKSEAKKDTKWHWHRSTHMDRDWELAESFADRYTPKAEDVGHYLRPTAVYDTPRHQVACAQVVSLGRVANGRANGSNSPPEFDSDSVERQVSKDARLDSLVGDPVTATDDDNDPLTYSLQGDDDNLFRIDPRPARSRPTENLWTPRSTR